MFIPMKLHVQSYSIIEEEECINSLNMGNKDETNVVGKRLHEVILFYNYYTCILNFYNEFIIHITIPIIILDVIFFIINLNLF